MSTIKNALEKAVAVIRWRAVSAVLLCAVTAITVLSVSQRISKVTIVDDDEEICLLTLSEPSDVLDDAGIILKNGDEIEQAQTGLFEYQLTVKRAFRILVEVDSMEKEILMTEGTVQQALDKAEISLNEDDVCNYRLTDEVEPGMRIEIQRVAYREVTEEFDVQYAEVRKNDATLLKGKTKVAQQGKNGVRTVVTQEKVVDGVVTETQVISDEVTQKAVDKVVLVGTKAAQSIPKTTTTKAQNPFYSNPAAVTYASTSKWKATVTANALKDHNGNTVNYSHYFDGKATAYTVIPGKTYSTTSTGRKAQYGVIAVNPKLIPYGSKLYICSADGRFVYGYAIAGDTGGGVMSGAAVADLFYNTVSDCYKFGCRNIRIYVLK